MPRWWHMPQQAVDRNGLSLCPSRRTHLNRWAQKSLRLLDAVPPRAIRETRFLSRSSFDFRCAIRTESTPAITWHLHRQDSSQTIATWLCKSARRYSEADLQAYFVHPAWLCPPG